MKNQELKILWYSVQMDSTFVEFRHVYAGYSPAKGMSALFSSKQSDSNMVLSDVSLSLHAKDHIVLFGPSASGKSTLLRLMAGTHIPFEGTIIINGKKPDTNPSTKLGYVSAEHAGKSSCSTSERVRGELERAANSDAPVILLDDIADVLGVGEIKKLLATVFAGRCAIIATRSVDIAEQLELPIYLLHKSSLAHTGTRESIAHDTGVARIVDAWVEGLRYDLLRKLRTHPGVLEVRLLPTDQFDGNRIRITLRNSRYLPSLYDVVSQATLVRIEELPPSLADILATLS